jgi:hypothetical protein
VIDKSPLYSSNQGNLMRLRSALPNAYYLHLTRHPRSQGESMMNVADGLMAIMANSIDYQAKPPVVDPQISWLEIQKNIVSFLEAVPETRRLQLRGEDVVTDPDSHLRQICAWLGIDQSEPSLRRMLQPEKSPFARLGPFGAHLGNDIGFLRSPALRKGKPHMPSLHDKLPWRPDGAGFSPAVVSMAQQLGYT